MVKKNQFITLTPGAFPWAKHQEESPIRSKPRYIRVHNGLDRFTIKSLNNLSEIKKHVSCSLGAITKKLFAVVIVAVSKYAKMFGPAIYSTLI